MNNASPFSPCFTITGASSPTSTRDRKSTRLNSSHLVISYAVFCLKKKKSAHRDSLSQADARLAFHRPLRDTIQHYDRVVLLPTSSALHTITPRIAHSDRQICHTHY